MTILFGEHSDGSTYIKYSNFASYVRIRDIQLMDASPVTWNALTLKWNIPMSGIHVAIRSLRKQEDRGLRKKT